MAQARQRLSEIRYAGHLREVISEPEARYSSVAAELCEARRALGLDLARVAEELRIGHELLVALEAARFEDLPGPPYVVGFIRSYATYLGLDAAALVARFKAEEAEYSAPSDLNFPVPYDEGRVPTGPLIAVALMLAGAAYAGWYYVTANDRLARDAPPEVPAAVIESVSVADTLDAARLTPAPPVETQPLPRAIAEVAASVAPDRPAPESVQAADVAADADDQSTPITPPAAESPAADVEVSALPTPSFEARGYVPRVYGQGNTDARVRLKAELESWVQVTGAGNELLLTRILRPGDVYLVPDRPGLVLMTGNAGGLAVIVGDETAPSLGPIGAVRRRVALDPERLLAGTAIEQ